MGMVGPGAKGLHEFCIIVLAKCIVVSWENGLTIHLRPNILVYTGE
jgi:hypothetical protein